MENRRYYNEDIKEILEKFESSYEGLDEKSLEKKRQTWGKNLLTKTEEKSFVKRVLTALGEPMVRILVFAIFLTVLINFLRISRGEAADWHETLGVTLSVILATSITVFMETRSQRAFEALNEMGENIKVRVLRQGVIKEVLKEDIYPGDVVILSAGDKVPADGRLMEALELEVDEAPLTGESAPVAKISEKIDDEREIPLGERINMVYSGTYVVSGSGRFIITETGDSTEIGDISKAVQQDYENITPLQKELGVLGKKIAWIGSGIAIIVFFLKLYNYHLENMLNMEGVAEALALSLVLIVSTIPEGLSTMVAAALALAVVKLSRENALVKKLASCEAIGAIDVICSDKTGTLTENTMSVVGEYVLARDILIMNIKLNNNSHLQSDEKGEEYYAGNPTEVALLEKVKRISLEKPVRIIYQYPFSSEKKLMGTVIETEGKIIYLVKGAPEKLMEISLLGEEYDGIAGKIETYQKEGKRIIAFCHKEVEAKLNWKTSQDLLEKEMIFDGFMVIADPIRKEVYSAVKECQKSGIEIKMLTGDNLFTARSIAEELHILNEKSIVLESSDIEKMSDYELKGIIDDIVVIARSKPMTKLRIVDFLMKQGKSVAVTGDGINDAPSLKRAEIGIAMGITGTEVAKETADVVLMNDSFATIVKAIEMGRGLYENFQKFIQFQQTVNVAALFLILVFEIFGWETPLRPIQILWINIMMDGPLAVSLSFEPTRKKIMEEKPRDKRRGIITGNMLANVLGTSIFMGLYMIFIIRYLRVSQALIPTYIFNLFIFIVIFNVYNCKEIGTRSIFGRIFDNKYLNVVFVAMFLIQIVVTTFFRKMFSVYLLSPREYAVIILFSFVVILFNELIKYIRRNGFAGIR